MSLSGATQKRVTVVFVAQDQGVVAKTREIGSALDSATTEAAELVAEIKKINSGLKSVDASEVNNVGKGAGGAASQTKAMAGGMSSFISKAAGLGAVALGFSALTGTLGQIKQLLDEISSQQIKNTAIARSQQISIEAVRASTRGQIDDVALATKANEAYRLGVAKTGVDMAKLGLVSNVLGTSIGQTADESLSSLTTGLARGSTAILDNLGITLKASEAQRIYAEQNNTTVAALSAAERAEAFRVVGMQKAMEATKQAAASNAEAAMAYNAAKTAMMSQSQSMFGYTDRIGLAREALRGITEQEFKLTKTMHARGADVQDLNESLKRYAEQQAQEASELLGYQVSANKFKITVEEIQALERDEGLDLFGQETEARRLGNLQAEADERRSRRELKAAEYGEEAVALEHQIQLREIMGDEEGNILKVQEQVLQARLEEAVLLQNEAGQLKVIKALELNRAKQDAAKRRRGGSGPSAADRVRAAGSEQVQALKHAAKLAETIATTDGEAVVVEERRREAALAAIELERQALDVTRARSKIQRDKLATKRAALDQKEEIIEAERLQAIEENSLRLVREAVALETQRADIEAQREARVIDMAQARGRLQERQINDQINAELRGELSAEKRARLEEERATKLHSLRLSQIEDEAQAQELEFEARERAVEAAAPETEIERLQLLDEQRQIAHDRELARVDLEIERRAAADSEAERLATAEAERLQRRLETLTQWQGAFTQVQGQATRIAGDMLSGVHAQRDEQVAQEIEGMEARGQARRAALDDELEGARGNAAAVADIQRRKAKLEADMAEKIERAQAAHNERKKREEMRFQGIQLLIAGAVSTAKAASAYPNIPSMVAHGVAAGLNFSYGAMLLAGQVPGASGASVGAGGSAQSFAGRESQNTSTAPTTPDSVPAADGQPNPTAGGVLPKGGGTVVINGNINALGTVDNEAINGLALEIDKATRDREGTEAA